MEELRPNVSFSPEPMINEKADTLSMFFENTPSFSKRVDNFLTVHFSQDNPDLMVGFSLKGIHRILKELRKVIVTANTPKVHVELILKWHAADCRPREVRPVNLEQLLQQTSRFEDAHVPLELSRNREDEACLI